MKLEQYLVEQDISYKDYCDGVDLYFSVDENIIKGVISKASGVVKNIFKMASTELDQFIHEFGIEVNELMEAFKRMEIYSLMKAVGFSLRSLMKGLHNFMSLINKGLLEVFKEIHDTKMFKMVQKGAMTVDELLDRYPLLKRVGGPAIAGILFYIWLNMTFVGSLDYDFDFTAITQALKGNYSIADLFGSPEGLMLMTLFGTGSIISAPWLGKTTYNLMLAIVYTALKMNKHKAPAVMDAMRNKIQTVRA